MRNSIPIINNEDVKRFSELSAIHNKSTAIQRIIELEKLLGARYKAEKQFLQDALDRAREIGFHVDIPVEKKEEPNYEKRFTDL